MLGLLLFGLGGALADEDHAKLIRVIGNDPSYKVRMQAIRILSKQLEKERGKPSDEVMKALSSAATSDEEHLVRGMACVALGRLGDRRGEPALVRALSDPEAFVRAQAEDAIKKVRSPASVAGGRRVLVIGTDRVPGVSASREMEESLQRLLTSGFQARAAGRFAVGETSGAGFHMKGSIAELSVTPAADGASQVTVVVKVAIATWPDNNLRHVMSARASARAKVAGPGLVRLQGKLLEAAVSKAIQDSMAQIEGG